MNHSYIYISSFSAVLLSNNVHIAQMHSQGTRISFFEGKKLDILTFSANCEIRNLHELTDIEL